MDTNTRAGAGSGAGAGNDMARIVQGLLAAWSRPNVSGFSAETLGSAAAAALRAKQRSDDETLARLREEEAKAEGDKYRLERNKTAAARIAERLLGLLQLISSAADRIEEEREEFLSSDAAMARKWDEMKAAKALDDAEMARGVFRGYLAEAQSVSAEVDRLTAEAARLREVHKELLIKAQSALDKGDELIRVADELSRPSCKSIMDLATGRKALEARIGRTRKRCHEMLRKAQKALDKLRMSRFDGLIDQSQLSQIANGLDRVKARISCEDSRG